MKKILLISNKIMHYRVSIYNYFYKRFRNDGFELIIRANIIQKQNENNILFNFKEIPFSSKKYIQELDLINPDAVILFLHLKEHITWLLLHWLKLKKIPFAWWNKPVNLDDPDNKFRYILFNYIHSISNALIVYSEKDIGYIKQKNRHKVFVANNTINFSDFPEVYESKDEIKKEFGITFKKVVLFVGRMEVSGGRKKVDHLIQIFNEIDIREAGLVIVGSGLAPEMLQRFKNENIMYMGEIHDPRNLIISKIFKMADLFCIPGHVGLGLNQAMFWGLPVVTEDGNQPPEIQYLINGKNGFIVPENDIEALKEKILLMLNDDEKRIQFGLNAKKGILENASIEGMYSGFKDCASYLVGEY